MHFFLDVLSEINICLSEPERVELRKNEQKFDSESANPQLIYTITSLNLFLFVFYFQ